MERRSRRETELLEGMDSLHFEISVRQRKLLSIIAELDERRVWEDDGCRDLAQWLSGRLGISSWTGQRWVDASHAISQLPFISEALENGRLCLDKVIELCRFATKETEQELVVWAKRVTVASVRHRAEVFNRAEIDEIRTAERARFLNWWWEQGGASLGFEGLLPAAEGAAFVKAIERIAERLAESPADQPPASGISFSARDRKAQRCADALCLLSSQAIAEDQDADRATVVVHATIDSRGLTNAEIEGGLGLHPDIAHELSCDCRLQYVLSDREGNALGIGWASRNVPRWLHRQLLYRDHGCTFPGCGTKMFLKAHHIHCWELGGPTDYDNLVLVCTRHHKLVHRFGWSVCLNGRVAEWYKPDGRRYDPGPDPPGERSVAA